MPDSPPDSLNADSPAPPPLKATTPSTWTDTVLADFDTFLQDHAAAEKKASGMALSMIAHYPDRLALVEALADLAVEELSHYREVIRWMLQRNVPLAADSKDDYVLAMRAQVRRGPEFYLLDRLLSCGIIEARGCERFGLVADALEPGPLKNFYNAITRSESRHYALFLQLAALYYPADVVTTRTNELLDAEAEIVTGLDISAALH